MKPVVAIQTNRRSHQFVYRDELKTMIYGLAVLPDHIQRNSTHFQRKFTYKLINFLFHLKYTQEKNVFKGTQSLDLIFKPVSLLKAKLHINHEWWRKYEQVLLKMMRGKYRRDKLIVHRLWWWTKTKCVKIHTRFSHTTWTRRRTKDFRVCLWIINIHISSDCIYTPQRKCS